MSKRRARGAISRDAVIDAALTVLDRDGFESVTIRALAAEVGVPPMTLYTHFASKEDLYDGMMNRAATRVLPAKLEPTWQRQLEATARQTLTLLRAHPSWLPLLIRERRNMPPGAIAFAEHLLGLMLEDGLAMDQALTAYLSVMGLAVGVVFAERFTGASEVPVVAQRLAFLREIVTRLPAGCDSYSSLARLASELDRWSVDSVFDLGVRSLIVGIEALSARGKAAKTRKAPARRAGTATPEAKSRARSAAAQRPRRRVAR